jgi:PAS domain S-box-containing protein
VNIGDQAPGFLTEGGEMGRLMRSHDFRDSPLGPPQYWPPSLRSIVALMLSSKFPMFVAWGAELGFLYNDAYAEILGAKHPKALGSRFKEIWGEIWADIWPLIESAMAGQATWREDLPLVMNRKGFDEQTWFTFSYSPVRDETGEIAGMFCACTETTGKILAQRRAAMLNATLEQRIREALAERKLLADIVENTDAFVQVVDLEYRWLAINRASADEFERIFGVRPRVGASMLDALAHHPQQRAAVEAVWSRALKAGERFTEIGTFGDERLGQRTYEMRFDVLRGADGKQIGAYQFVYDVTERLREQARLREAEEGMRQVQKMETIGQLTGGVAHDINNLLTPIVGALDLTRRRLSGDDERSRKLIDGALQAADRARVLVQRLLAFARRQHLRPRAVDVAALIEGMHDMMSRLLGSTIEVRVEVGSGLFPAQVDPNQLELALLNLAVNARDAMGGQGVVRISVAPETAGTGPALAPGRYVRLSVSDDGAGMDEVTLRRATEPFFTTKGIAGTGLGLSSVQGLAEQSGGRLDLRSTPGQGTIVTLWLPESSEPLEEIGTPGPIEPIRVEVEHALLLVDDEILVRTGTAAMLREAGFVVLEAASGNEALSLIDGAASIDAVITDYAMPGLNGSDLARRLREARPDLPILLITGYATLSDAEAAGLPRLAKPFRAAELAAAVGALFKSRESTS